MEKEPRKKSHVLLITFLVLIGLIIGAHSFIPGFPGLGTIAGTTFGLLVAGTTIFCVSVLLLFLFTGIGALILGILLFVWTIVAIVLFPVLFPIFLPLFLIFLFISLIRRKK